MGTPPIQGRANHGMIGQEPAGGADEAIELPRLWRAVLIVDVVESVRLMQAHESAFIRCWRRFVDDVRQLLLPTGGGRLVKSLGDGLLLEFNDAPVAAQAAFWLHERMSLVARSMPADACPRLRAGLHVAEVVVDGLDIYGPGVNVAARVAALAAPGETIATVQARDQLLDGIDVHSEDLGALFVKHLDSALHCFRLHRVTSVLDSAATTATTRSETHTPSHDAQLPRMAVMPLQVRGLQGDELSAGHLVADNLSLRLARNPLVRVIARGSANALASRGLMASELAARLEVRYLVTGSLTRLRDARWRLTVELVESPGDTVMWSRTDTLDPDLLLEPDDDYTAEVAMALMAAVASLQVKRTGTHSLPSLQSYSLHLAGLQLMHRTAISDFERARPVLETLVERHPLQAMPRTWLSQWWVLRTTRLLSPTPREDAAQALSHTRVALQAAPDNALALATQGFVECHLLRDLAAAETTLERALACGPNEALAWLYRSVVHGFRGEGVQAWRHAETALSLSPLDPQRHYFDALCGAAAIIAGEYPRGIALAERALRANRHHPPTLRALALGQVESGDVAAGRQTMQRLLVLEPGFTIRDYLGNAPAGGEAARERFARALATAGAPLG
jgi:adenylate cyclase